MSVGIGALGAANRNEGEPRASQLSVKWPPLVWKDQSTSKPLYKTHKWLCHWPQVGKQGEFRNIQQFTSKLCSDERRILRSHEGCHICLGSRRPENTTELLGSYSMETLWTSNTSAIRSRCLWDKSSSLFILFHLLKHIWIVQYYSSQGGELCLFSPSLQTYFRGKGSNKKEFINYVEERLMGFSATVFGLLKYALLSSHMVEVL